jgi:predicted ATPase
MKAGLEAIAGKPAAAARFGRTVVELSEQHGLALYRSIAEVYLGWAHGQIGDLKTGSEELRWGLASYVGLGAKLFAPIFRGLLAELEARTNGADSGLASVDEALALAQQTAEHWSDGFLYRVKGEILLKRGPESLGLAEEALRTAIALAREQGARSLQLLAALALAKLYQSTRRSSDASNVLGPALEGLSPTPEMPEIAEAQALLERLKGSEGAITSKD